MKNIILRNVKGIVSKPVCSSIERLSKAIFSNSSGNPENYILSRSKYITRSKTLQIEISKNSTEIDVFHDSREYFLTTDPIIKRFEEIL